MISITNFSDINKRFLLRFGARYVDFWKNKDGNIFNVGIHNVKLKNLLEFASTKVIKKDSIDKIYQLIDLANIEPETGYPQNLEDNIVNEIGSDKIYLSDSDLVFSKLNSHIGYVFLTKDIPDNGYDIIGSTEFYPLKLKTDQVKLKLLKYFLLHNSFRNITIFLRSGKSKSHPRIQKDDFFNLKIPILDEKTQNILLKKFDKLEKKIQDQRNRIEPLTVIINEVFDKNGLSIQPDLHKDEKFQFSIEFKDVNQTPWLSCRPYLHRFLKYELKNHINNKLGNNYLDFSKYIKTLWSGEYIPKYNYSESETDYIYLKIGNVSNNEFNFNEITYLNPEIGTSYLKIQLLTHDLIITRSGTVGRCVIFESNLIPDKKIIPSHHLAIIRLNSLTDALFLKYYVQSSFGTDFLWALSTGKVQKEITNWSIKKLPIPIIDKKEKIVKEIQSRELKTKEAIEKIKRVRKQIDDLISEELSKVENRE